MMDSEWNEFYHSVWQACRTRFINTSVPSHCLSFRPVGIAELALLRLSPWGPMAEVGEREWKWWRWTGTALAPIFASCAVGLLCALANILCLAVFRRLEKRGVGVSRMQRCLVYGDLVSLCVGSLWHVPVYEGLGWERSLFACRNPILRLLFHSVPVMAGCALFTNALLLAGSRERLAALRDPMAYRLRADSAPAWRILLPAALPSFAVGFLCYGELSLGYLAPKDESRSLACRYPHYYAKVCLPNKLKPLSDAARALPNLFYRENDLCPFVRTLRPAAGDAVMAGALCLLLLGQLYFGLRMLGAYRKHVVKHRALKREAWTARRKSLHVLATSRLLGLTIGVGVGCSALLLLAMVASAGLSAKVLPELFREPVDVALVLCVLLQLLSNPIATFLLSRAFRAQLWAMLSFQ